MLGTPYLCAFYVATAGLQGASLGSDEEEIVLLIYVIIDMTQNKVVGMQQHIVKPSKVDTKENEENILSEQITTETSLTDDLVKNSGVPLEAAIKQTGCGVVILVSSATFARNGIFQLRFSSRFQIMPATIIVGWRATVVREREDEGERNAHEIGTQNFNIALHGLRTFVS
ncbi:hypothetical protein V9T40_005164 [Parthenolecanium corni]|uniref:Uncharacterized protein n=1 Tax=Parthenolecanium corni TaxID=536013 RepID=A0AAN9TFC0_9HEMI